MNSLATALPGVVILEPRAFRDARGSFMETWNLARYADAGLPASFVQDNVSLSKRGVLRGLHYQHPAGQGKLVMVLQGEVLDVAVDLRVGSPTFARWVGVALSGENRRQLFIPDGFAHGFAVVSRSALVLYKCTTHYRPDFEGGLRWDDPAIGIEWPLVAPALSEKDRLAPRLFEIPSENLPSYRGEPSTPNEVTPCIS